MKRILLIGHQIKNKNTRILLSLVKKKYDIFMNEEGKPIGDKWNFDKDNRKGIKQLKSDIPERKKLVSDQITFDAMVDVEECFPNSIGTLKTLIGLLLMKKLENLLDDFIERYLLNYGSFQDAINKENTFMFHSLFSPYLNCGLLDPKICIEKAEKNITNQMEKFHKFCGGIYKTSFRMERVY